MSTIGQILKEAREAKNVSIEEAQRVTKIQLNILASLEQDAFDNLPNPTYIRGFIKQYAQYLGLDPEPLLKEYSSLNVKPPEQEIVVKSKDDELKSSQPVKPKVPVGKKKNNSIVIISIAAVSVLIIAGLFFFVMSGKESPQEGVSSKKEPSKPLLVKRNRPLKLTIFANKDSWMHIKCDGNIVYQNILKAGLTETLEAKNEIVLWVGNAAGLDLDLNGHKLDSPGRGVIKNILITHEGMTLPDK